MNTPTPQLQNTSPEEVTKRGEEIYFNELKSKLESTNKGDYVVIEVVSKKYFIDKDLLNALNKAKEKYPDKLFFIVQIGTLQNTSMGYRKQKNAWLF